MASGETVDIVLNPLGVPSRMNIGQILKCTWAGRQGPGSQDPGDAGSPGGGGRPAQVPGRHLQPRRYQRGQRVDLSQFSDEELLRLACNSDGVPMATPVFDGAEAEIKRMLEPTCRAVARPSCTTAAPVKHSIATPRLVTCTT